MSVPESIPTDARAEADIFSDLRLLCTSPGYIHAIAFFCWRDNFIRYRGAQVIAKDLDHQYSHDKLLRTEISTLIGLMIQKSVDFSLPQPRVLEDYVTRTETLLQELHHSLMKPWFEGWKFDAGEIPENDPFDNAASLREPIFYSSESAYNFQYLELTCLKYNADDEWLEANKGFRITDACQVTEAIGKLQNKHQIEWRDSLRTRPPGELTALPAFSFTAEEVADSSGVAVGKTTCVLDAFTCAADEHNTSFTALNEFNVISSAPILKPTANSYLLLQHYSLLEAIYETPFFWMIADKAYAPIANANRGRFTEGFVTQRLEAVFGKERVLHNINIYKGKNRIAEADVLVLFGNHALVVQAKSKRLTIEARKGNDLQLKSDFKKAVQDAYDQAFLCSEALVGDGYKFIDASDAEIALPYRPGIVFPICAVSDHYPALAFQARQFLKTKSTLTVQPPLVTDVFALDVFAEMLNTPLHFLNYLALRSRFIDKLVVSHELAILGFHLSHNLWLDDQYNMVNLGDDFTGALDIAMMARRVGVPGERMPKGVLTRFEKLSIGRLLSEIEKVASPELTGLGLLLLQLSQETAKGLSTGIDRILRQSKIDGKNHDISLTPDEADSGITIHCNELPEEIARERLYAHCKLRKYDTKANAWYGLLLNPATGGIRGAMVIEENWESDSQMDALMATWRRKPPVPIAQIASIQVASKRKIGRNEPCPCGSGKKYKKCCLSVTSGGSSG